MKYMYFGQQEQKHYPICILVNKLRRDNIINEYIEKFDLDPDDIIAIQLPAPIENGVKLNKAGRKLYLSDVLSPILDQLQTQYVLMCDGDFFKVAADTTKVEVNLGYVLKSPLLPNQHLLYAPAADTVFYDPGKVRPKIAQTMQALIDHAQGEYQPPGDSIIHYESYPDTVEAIREWLQHLLDLDCDLTCDIEAFSLKHYSAGIGTITFCWNQHEGIAFPVDFLEPEDAVQVRSLLKEFFMRFERKMIYHKIDYDVTVLIYQLFMYDILDTAGLFEGLFFMMRNWDDTRIIAYLATNSCSGNRLSLKDQAQEFAGNYAMHDIKDITKIPLDQLLRYNLVDGLSTWFVHNKHFQQMQIDEQENVYNEIFKPAMMDIIQMQLTGMPIDMERVKEVRVILEHDVNVAMAKIDASPFVQAFTYQLNEEWVREKNETLKKKRVTIEDGKEVFNPNSGPQLVRLLYEQIGLPIIGTTDTGLPSTEGDILKALKKHTNDDRVKALLDVLIDFKAVYKILTSTLVHMEAAVQGPDGWHWLFGCFNLGGTVSGRLSSSDPNLQNLPATGTRYAKLIKSCFKAPPGWLWVGIDFDSLEDKISAITTKDPNKIKVYTDGYDGHSLRAYFYYTDQMPDINPNSVASINSIGTKGGKYEGLRQESKPPTFALTYQGTFKTLMTNCGFSEQKAKAIEESYKKMYSVSIAWVNKKLEQASKDGYVTLAFGLRLRTPLLHQVVIGNRRTPFEATAEGRTAGNALGQGWCLLNSRAGSEFMGKVRSSEHRYAIKPSAQIHDAQYFLIRDDIDVILFTNTHLVKAVSWQDHPEIQSDEVKLSGKLGIFHPNWATEYTVPANANEEILLDALTKHYLKMEEEKAKKEAA
jgi:DNA polymerase-1